MSTGAALSDVPVARRRRSAVFAAGFAAVLLLAGILPWAMPTDGVIRFLAVFVIVAGALAAFVAVGLLRSIRVAPPRASTGGGCGAGCQCGQQTG